MKEILLPEDFLNKPIAIDLIGAGGNGSQMLYGLAKIHFGLLAIGHPHGLAVRLYDPDSVTDANVGRQSFSPADVGHNKAIILIHRVNTFYGLNWDAVGAKYNEDRRQPHLVIGCVDSAKSRQAILTCVKRNWSGWWLDLGNSERTGQVVLGKYSRIIDDKTRTRDAALERECRPPTVLELFPHLADPKLKEDDTPSCSLAVALQRQDLFINQTVATFALHLLWSWLSKGRLNHHGYFINLEMGQVMPMKLDPEAWQRIRDNSKPKAKRKAKAKANNSRPSVKKQRKPASPRLQNAALTVLRRIVNPRPKPPKKRKRTRRPVQ